MLVILLTVDVMRLGAIAASLGASSFIVFVMPKRRLARHTNLICGHLLGVASAALMWLILFLFLDDYSTVGYPHYCAAAAAVALSTFLMIVTDLEHPPAAGTALGVTLEVLNYKVVLIILIGVCSLSIIHHILRNHLEDLR